MTLRTRLFGQKVEGEALRGLLRLMGHEPNKVLDSSTPDKWGSYTIGKCRIIPKSEGLYVDLHLNERQVHVCDGSLPVLEHENRMSLFSDDEKIDRSVRHYNLNKLIPYTNK